MKGLDINGKAVRTVARVSPGQIAWEVYEQAYEAMREPAVAVVFSRITDPVYEMVKADIKEVDNE